MIKREPVDVIILDLHLRQGTGFGVMRTLATTHLKPRIVVLTNNDLPEYKKTAFALGATHYLDKLATTVDSAKCCTKMANPLIRGPNRVRDGRQIKCWVATCTEWNNRS